MVVLELNALLTWNGTITLEDLSLPLYLSSLFHFPNQLCLTNTKLIIDRCVIGASFVVKVLLSKLILKYFLNYGFLCKSLCQ